VSEQAGPGGSPAETALRVARMIDAVAYAAIALLRSREAEAEIPDVLRVLGEAAGVSRIYIYENTTLGGELADIERFEWVAPGVARTFGSRNESYPYLPDYERYIRVLGTGGIIAELTEEAPPSERKWLEEDGTLSTALVPIFVRDAWWGYIGFDDCWEARVWSKAELSTLRVAAETLGAALERQGLDAALAVSQRQRQDLEDLLREAESRIQALEH